MSALLKLDWHGKPIKRRAQDDWFDLTAIVIASNAHTGNKAVLKEWLSNKDTQRFLLALSKETGIPVSLGAPREGGNSPLLALIEQRGKGAHIWGHKTAALRLCAWLDADLEVKIYSWVQAQAERSRRPRPLDAAAAQLVLDRRDAHKRLAAVAIEVGATPSDAHMGKVYGLTGRRTQDWKAELGDRWQETAPLGHQYLERMAADAAANALASLPEEERNSRGTAYRKCKEAGSDLRVYAEKYGLPWKPTYDGPAFTSARIHRVLAAG